jgi:hypothetical protein
MTRVEAMRSSKRFGKALFAVLVIGVVLLAVWVNTKPVAVAPTCRWL